MRNEDGKIRVGLVAVIVCVSLMLAAAAMAATVYVVEYRVSDDSIVTCVAANGTSSQWTNPDAGAMYDISATGANVYLLGAANPTATASANGHFTVIHEGTTRRIPLTSAKIAHITSGGTGEICFVRQEAR